MSEGWFVRNEHELKCLIEFCQQSLASGQELRFNLHKEDIRTDRQNRALWKACEMLGESLNDAGFDMRRFPFKEGVDLPWDKESVKKRLFDPIMAATTEKQSSRKLTKKEVSQVWDILLRHLASTIGVSVPFPSWEHYYEKKDHRKQSSQPG